MFFRRLSIIGFFIILVCNAKNVAFAKHISNVTPPVRYFTGRNKLILKINTLFALGENVVSVVGISGIGKTELVRSYAATKTNFKAIWFFDCSVNLPLQFQQLARQINLKYGNGKQLYHFPFLFPRCRASYSAVLI